MKERVLRWELSHDIRGFFNSFTGYFKGFGNSLVNDVVPLGLGLTALLAKNKRIAKASAIGLGAVAIFSFFKDGLGIGKSKQVTLPTE